ncbi:MAG: helix-turn-helix domain-containing protein [bacterium]
MDRQIKNTILEASLNLFKRFGYKKTTIEEIAREAGIGKGSVYLHFNSKEDILLTLIKRHHQTMIEEWVRIVHTNCLLEKKISNMLIFSISEIQKKKEEIFLPNLPPSLLQSVLKMSELTREQRLDLLTSVLEQSVQKEGQILICKKVIARVLLDSVNNIAFRLDIDKNFLWEEYLNDLLMLLLRR